MFAEDLGVFLGDFGVPCVAPNGHAFTGILDTPDEVMNMAGVNVQSTMYALTVKTSDVQAAALDNGVAVTVNGQAFTVRGVLLRDDGAFTVVTLNS